MKTLLLNPPSFENFDGGASSRWPATREIASFWYPVWLAYPAAMIKESRLLDAPPHGIGVAETLQIARDYDFVAIFTSTAGFQSDVQLAEAMKAQAPSTRIGFVGPPVSVEPEKSLRASRAIDFVVRKEFDYQIKDYAEGKCLSEIPGVSYWKDGEVVHNPELPLQTQLSKFPWVTPIYKRDLDFRRYNVPFLLNPFISFYTARGCPALCTFCLWPQTFDGHPWRTRDAADVADEVRYTLETFPGLREIFFDDDTFTIRKDRVLELCEKFKPLKFTWSCTSRVHVDLETLKAMKAAGCRLFIVGFESGDAQVLKNIKKGATVEQARTFVKNCKKAGIVIHGDFIIGLPGETPESIERTVQFAEELDCETIQVSIAHAYPGTEFFDYLKRNDYFTNDSMTDEQGHQLPNFEYPGLSRGELVQAVEHFYDRYYFRPRVVFRIVRKAFFNGAERRRLYREAREYLTLRAKRRAFVRAQQEA
ncbi:MAG: hopanoid biosynthesis associated radical SAM protein HpnJ [Acidobacteria bacterium]|nr:hopanoid biosynthesis associated radical SAM protein HpnJ [Acidobacteriota bacterium]